MLDEHWIERGRRLRFLALNASERPDGNLTRALEWAEALLDQEGADLEVVRLWDLDIRPCGACGDCNFRNEPCSVDDGVRDVVACMAGADALLYCVAVHGYGVAPTMSAFLERSGTGHLRFDRVLTNKVGGAIVAGRRYSHVETYNQVLQNILLTRMIVPGYGFPAVLFGNDKGEVLEDEEGMEMLSRMLRRMVRLSRVLSEHRLLTGEDLLAEEVRSERHRLATR